MFLVYRRTNQYQAYAEFLAKTPEEALGGYGKDFVAVPLSEEGPDLDLVVSGHKPESTRTWRSYSFQLIGSTGRYGIGTWNLFWQLPDVWPAIIQLLRKQGVDLGQVAGVSCCLGRVASMKFKNDRVEYRDQTTGKVISKETADKWREEDYPSFDDKE